MFKIIPDDLDVDFLGKRKIVGLISFVLVVASILAVIFIGLNYGIDFKGGSDIILKVDGSVSADTVRDAADTIFPDANVQQFGDPGSGEFLIQTAEVSVVNSRNVEDVKKVLEPLGTVERLTWNPEQPDRLDVKYTGPVDTKQIVDAVTSIGLANVDVEQVGVAGSGSYVVRFQDLGRKVRDGFEAALGDGFDPAGGLERLETVGPRVGEQLRNSGFFSVLVALLMILIYIAFRFDIRYAPGAVIALTHDVAISLGIFTLIGMEISLPIIAALLTVVGYSLNDTIVVFDRIRENVTEAGDEDFYGTTNLSINQTLSRTIMTSLTTLLAVIAIYQFGGGLIRDFAFALIIGVIVGTYSSIFIASPITVFMDRYIRARRASQRAMQA